MGKTNYSRDGDIKDTWKEVGFNMFGHQKRERETLHTDAKSIYLSKHLYCNKT